MGHHRRVEMIYFQSSFPNTRREHGAFAAGFGHALSRLLALPLTVTVAGAPGDPSVRALARAALTQMRHGDLVLNFREGFSSNAAQAEVSVAGRPAVCTSNAGDIRPGLV